MTAKKKEDQVVGQSLAPVITALKSEPPKEKLLSFRAITFFSDGNLREFMERYGYSVEWRMNEVRALPSWLIQRCLQSGAELDRADG